MAEDYSSAFLEVIFLRTKLLIGIGIVATIASTTYFVVQQNMLLAGLSIIGMFILTNLLRTIAFGERGMVQEAKLMRLLSIFFGVVFIGLLVVVIFK